ncbi:MAG TPA: hypothetical protein VNZ44_09295 [Pyrinomonadaceae bacterium]|nr:hypothetical protein [Pyrinomonadaceae bacterium]
MYTNRSAKLYAAPARCGRLSTHTLALAALVAFACHAAPAQEPAPQQQPDASAQQQRDEGPPPMRYLPEDVRHRVEAEHDFKDRARLGMLIAEERLERAAQLAEADRFVDATAEIGVYEAVVEDTLRYLQTSGKSSKLRDVYKRVEITLRSHVTRLETIRRGLPERHGIYLKDAIDFVRDNRDLALGAFYSDTVVREPRRPAATAAAGAPAGGNTAAQADPEKKPDQKK